MFQWRRRKHRRRDMEEAARTLEELRSLVGGAGSPADGIGQGKAGIATSSSTDAAHKVFLDTKAVTHGRPRGNDADRAANDYRCDEPETEWAGA